MQQNGVTFQPLHPKFGAVVDGIDCANPQLDSAAALTAALDKWKLLLFRDQSLSDQAFVTFCRLFGALELLPEPEKRHPEFPEIFNLSNVKADGSLTAFDDPQAVFLRGTSRWHTDSSFREIPCLATILHALEVPSEGGDTEFADMVAAYDSLSDAEKSELVNLEAVHSYAYSRAANPGKLPPMTVAERRRVPDIVHPVIRQHADGRRSVYLGGHVSHLSGQPVTESRARVRALEEKLTGIGNLYRHRWRAGDVLIWDNRTTLHRLTDYAIHRDRRTMRRCTVQGEETVTGVGSSKDS